MILSVLHRGEFTNGRQDSNEQFQREKKEKRGQEQSHINVGPRACHDGAARYLVSNSIKLDAVGGRETHPQFSA